MPTYFTFSDIGMLHVFPTLHCISIPIPLYSFRSGQVCIQTMDLLVLVF